METGSSRGRGLSPDGNIIKGLAGGGCAGASGADFEEADIGGEHDAHVVPEDEAVDVHL
jgi:hypothetical protein